MIIHKHAQGLNFYRFLVDIALVFVSWLLSYVIRFDTGIIALPLGDDTLQNYLRVTPALIASYVFVFISAGVYKRALDKRRIWEEHLDLARTHLFAFFVFVTTVYFLFEHRFSRITMLIFFILVPLALPIGRSAVRKLNRAYLRARKNFRNAIIVGSGPLASKLAELIEVRRDWYLKLHAIFPPAEIKAVHSLLENTDVATVFVAANPDEMPHIQRIYEGLGNTVAEVYLIPDLGLPAFLSPRVVHVDGLPAIALNTSNLDGYGRFVKRAYDIAFSLCFLILISPVFLLCALAVRLSSRGPIFYKQERMGLDGKTFQCLKFRGMYVNAEEKTGPVWATANDTRTTPIGRWLRKTSLDELPQFINVIKGEMSVVGPRPERPVFVGEFRNEIPGYMLRHTVKAGITGWAQVNGWRGNTSLEKRIECDIWYIQNWSLWLDIKICLLTPFRGFIHPNAY